MELVPKHIFDRKMSYIQIGPYQFTSLSVPLIKEMNPEEKNYIYMQLQEHHKHKISDEVSLLLSDKHKIHLDLLKLVYMKLVKTIFIR